MHKKWIFNLNNFLNNKEIIRASSLSGIWGNVTDTTCVSSSESDVSFFSPWSTPRVLNFPWFTRNTNQKNTVIKRGLAVIEDSWFIWWPVGSINCNWNWSAHYIVSKGVAGFIVLDVSKSFNRVCWSHFFTCLFFSCVRIVSLGSESSVLDDVFEGSIH